MKIDITQVTAQAGMKKLLLIDGVEKSDTGGAQVVAEQSDVVETSSRQPVISEKIRTGLEHYQSKLTSLNMPATKETALLMKNILAENPNLTMEEAAFLASNKITDSSEVKTAISMLSDGDKTDTMIKSLIEMLSEHEVTRASFVKADAPSSPLSPLAVTALNTAPLTKLLTMVMRGEIFAQVQITKENHTLHSTIDTPIIAEAEAPQPQEFKLQQNRVQTTATVNPSTAATSLSQAPIITEQGEQVKPILQDASFVQTINENQTESTNRPETTATQSALPEVKAQKEATNQNLTPEGISKELASILSEIPEFKGTPPEALERFTNMLLKIAGETISPETGQPEKPEALLDKLFTRIDFSDPEMGTKLKDAKSELFARLALIDEAISQTTSGGTSELSEQSTKLLEHVRVLNNIETFAYLQLPVKLGQEQKSADLYIFKKKGGKKPDPENINILLSLDLEYMGHWESLINIKNTDISLQMEVAGEAEKDHFSQNTVILHDMLAQAGFKLTGTDITQAKQETNPLTALSTLEKFQSAKSGKIDFFY